MLLPYSMNQLPRCCVWRAIRRRFYIHILVHLVCSITEASYQEATVIASVNASNSSSLQHVYEYRLLLSTATNSSFKLCFVQLSVEYIYFNAAAAATACAFAAQLACRLDHSDSIT
jgi:hypothetical protein